MKETYKKLIMEFLETLDGEALKSIYSFIRGMVAGKGGVKYE